MFFLSWRWGLGHGDKAGDRQPCSPWRGPMAPSVSGLMGGGPRRGCSGSLKPFSAHGALALGTLVYSPTEPSQGLWKRLSLWPSPLPGALLVGWDAELDALGEGSGGPDPAAPEAPAEPENLHGNLLLPASPCKRSWVPGLWRSGKSRQVITTLTKTTPKSSKPLSGHKGFHPGTIPALKPLASSRCSQLWLI